MIRKIPFVVAMLAALVCSSDAQPAPTIKAEVRLLSFNPEDSQNEAFIQDPAAPATAVAVPAAVKDYLNHEFSTVLLTTRKFVVTTKPTRASLTAAGETLAEVTLPEGVNSVIVLCLPGKEGGKTKFQGFVINDAKRAFPAGSYHATNLSPLPIRLMLEQKQFNFKAGETVLIQDPPMRAGNQSGMRTFAFENDAWQPIATGIWSPPGERRTVLVFFHDKASGTVQLRSFDDIKPREPQEEKKPQ